MFAHKESYDLSFAEMESKGNDCISLVVSCSVFLFSDAAVGAKLLPASAFLTDYLDPKAPQKLALYAFIW